jgi:hypothetical protein
MRPQTWHVLLLLLYPLLFVAAMFVLYWVIRLAVRAGIKDADERRGGGPSGPASGRG